MSMTIGKQNPSLNYTKATRLPATCGRSFNRSSPKSSESNDRYLLEGWCLVLPRTARRVGDRAHTVQLVTYAGIQLDRRR
jgi:hypothetical protein